MKLALFLLVVALSALPAAEFTLSWSGGGLTQNWEEATNWQPNGIPCNAGADTYNAFIGGGAGVVTINNSCTLQSIEMQTGPILHLANGQTLTIRDYFLNLGSVSPDSTGNPTTISINDSSGDGQVAIGGAGLITLDTSLEQITGTFGNTLVHNAGHTIRGTGSIGANAIDIVNAGFIIADSPSNILQVDPLSTFENNVGLLVAENGGILRLEPATYNDVNGTIRVEDGSEIVLNSITLNGGSFSKFDPNGILDDNKVTVLGNTRLNGVTNEVSLRINNGATLNLGDGDFLNNGRILPLSSGNPTTLSVGDAGGDQVFHLGGSGDIVLDSANEQIVGTFGHLLVHDTPHEISGGGAVGQNSIDVTNHSLVAATNASVPLAIDPLSTWTNDGGMLSAVSGTLMLLQSGTYSCVNGGQFLTGDDAEQRLSGVTATNCPFNADDIDSDVSNNRVAIAGSSTFDTCTSQCPIVVANGQTLTLKNGDFFDGSFIDLDSTGNPTTLLVTDPSDLVFTLTGPGTLFLDSPVTDNVTGTFGHTLVHDTAHHIEGSGNLGANAIELVNRGTIVANRSGETLNVDPLSTYVNDGGSLTVTNGATLLLAAGTYTSTNGGSYTIDDGTSLLLQGITCEDMNLEVSDADMNVSNNLARLTGSSIFDGVVNDAFLEVANGLTLTLRDQDFTNNAPLQLDSTGNPTSISITDLIDQELTIDGTGTIFLDSTNDQITGSSGHTLIQAAGHTIEGAGQIGRNALNLVNRGTIVANRTGETLFIDPVATYLNDGGSLTATNGAIIKLESGTYGVANGGSYTIGDDCDFILNGVTLESLQLEVADVDLDPSNNRVSLTGSSIFRSLVNEAELHVENGRTLTVRDGDFTNNAPLHLDSTGNPTSFFVTDNIDQQATLLGTGTIFLDDATTDQITGSSGHTLIQDAGHTIEGAGRIGTNALNLVNRGTIVANRTGETLFIDPVATYLNDGGSLTATNGATIRLESGTYSVANGGSYTIDDGCEFILNGVTLDQIELEVANSDADLSNNRVSMPGSSTFLSVVNGAELHVENGRTLTVRDGDFTNNGPLHLDSTGNPTSFSITDNIDQQATLLGTGTIFLDAGSLDVITGASGHTLIQGAGHRIEGAGLIGTNALNLINHGVIESNRPGETLTIDPVATYVNDAGTLSATNGGLVTFGIGTYSSINGGVYSFADDSTLTLNGPVLQGLSLDVVDNDTDLSNNLFLVTGSSTFNGVTSAGEIRIANGRTLLLLDGDFTNYGTVNPDTSGNDTSISINGAADQRLAILGTGEIRLDSPQDVITGIFGHTLVNGPDHTIRGFGRIANGSIRLENQGLISADVAGETLLLDNNGVAPANTGILQAVAGGTLQFQETQTNLGGEVYAETGSLIVGLGAVGQIEGLTRVDGELQATALNLSGGSLQGTGLVDATLGTTDSLVMPGNSTGTLTVEGDATLGTGSSLQVEIAATADHDLLAVTSGNLGLAGAALELRYGGGPGDVLNTDILTIVTCTGMITGEFINVADGARLNSSDGLVSFQVNYLTNAITLTDFLYLGGSANQGPVFTSFTLSLDVPENTPPGTLLFDFDAYDPEGVVIDYLPIPLIPFEMNATTGELRLAAPLDFETLSQWLVTIQASDGVNTTELMVTVNVQNVSDTNEEIVTDLLTLPAGPFPGETDPLIIGFAADPDHDGRGNVFELWLGTDPAVADLPAPFIIEPTEVSGSDHGSITLVVDGSVEDLLDVRVEFSFDLNAWRDATGSRFLVSSVPPLRTLRFTDSVPLGPGGRFFARFRAEPDAQK